MNSDPLARKSLGQHWLNDAGTLDAICELAQIDASDTVLEIGAGTGSLTKAILAKGAQLVALELDETLVGNLKNSFADQGRLTVEQGDIRRYNLSNLSAGYKIVANIPYYLTANLLRILVDAANKPQVTVLLIQKEVAQRVAARPGDMSFISLAVQFYYGVSLGPIVPPRLFTPPPKVDSQVLVLKKLDKPMFAGVEIDKFFRLGKAGFAQPRKTLVNNLSSGLGIDKPTAKQIVQKTGLATNIRAQELSMEDWHNLYTAVDK